MVENFEGDVEIWTVPKDVHTDGIWSRSIIGLEFDESFSDVLGSDRNVGKVGFSVVLLWDDWSKGGSSVSIEQKKAFNISTLSWS